MYWNLNNLYGWAMSQALPVDGLKWRIDKFTFDEEFIHDYDKNNDKEYILEVDVNYLKKLCELHSICCSYPKERRLKK